MLALCRSCWCAGTIHPFDSGKNRIHCLSFGKLSVTLRKVFTESGLKDRRGLLRSRRSYDLSDWLRQWFRGWGWLGGWHDRLDRMRNGTGSLGGGDWLGSRGVGSDMGPKSRSLGDSLVSSDLIDSGLSGSNLSLSRSDDLIGVSGLFLVFPLFAFDTNLFKPLVTNHGLNTLIGQHNLTLLVPIRVLIGGVGDLGKRVLRLSRKPHWSLPIRSHQGKVNVSGEFIAFVHLFSMEEFPRRGY
jgi:hypothetical protein